MPSALEEIRRAEQAILDDPTESTLRKAAEWLAPLIIADSLNESLVVAALLGAWLAATGEKGTATREIARGLEAGGAKVSVPKTDVARADLKEAVSEVRGASVGRRHDTLFERAAYMGKHVKAGTLSAAEVRSALMGAWSAATSGRNAEGVRTINDGLAGARGAFQYGAE